MSSKEDIEVTHQDQQRINSFATWNLKYKDYISEHEQKKKDLGNINEAEDELILSDCDSHRFLIGETFFHLSADEVNEELNSAKETTKARMVELDELISDSKAQMQTLKKELYAKFGTHINLEED
ncbi:Prefoldin subunit 4 [Fasciola hepatica]|uniref:Prefoldin subunit 4 n=1 Tax=Fasciola hepatica TaxID=6192 RepID=A0A4E0RA31_FASHE|nr:Prefoldin subunit 4 [Fasciola hepatica]